MDLQKKYEEKYKDVDLKDASSHYYGDGNAMDRVLAEMQDGIDSAVTEYEKVKGNYDSPHVLIFINQDSYKISFSIAVYDEDEDEYTEEAQFFSHSVGEAMAEALVLMQMMEDSDVSTGISQAVNNWAEDLDLSGFGEFDSDYSISDSWELIDY